MQTHKLLHYLTRPLRPLEGLCDWGGEASWTYAQIGHQGTRFGHVWSNAAYTHMQNLWLSLIKSLWFLKLPYSFMPLHRWMFLSSESFLEFVFTDERNKRWKPLRRTILCLLSSRVIHLGFKEQHQPAAAVGKHEGEWDNAEAEIGPGGTCLPVDTAETSTLTPSELGSRESCGAVENYMNHIWI